jgi:hypothetical protein
MTSLPSPHLFFLVRPIGRLPRPKTARARPPAQPDGGDRADSVPAAGVHPRRETLSGAAYAAWEGDVGEETCVVGCWVVGAGDTGRGDVS